MADADSKEGDALPQQGAPKSRVAGSVRAGDTSDASRPSGGITAEADHGTGKVDESSVGGAGSVPVKGVMAEQVADPDFAGASAVAAEHDAQCTRLGAATAPMWGQKFVPVGNWDLETPKSNRRTLSVMSFNVLAQVRCMIARVDAC